MRMSVMAWGLSAALVAGGASAQDVGGFEMGGEEQWAAAGSPDGCVSAAQRAEVEAAVRAFEESEAALRWRARGGFEPELFRFYPQAGNLYRDLYHNNYVDLDFHTSGVLDFDCSDHTYDGHRGHDSGIRTFAEQDIGVPVYAVNDGVVVSAHDGEFDRNTVWMGQPANYVVLRHASGITTRYWHLRNGSVAVSAGQVVEAGEQIGLTASSGNSTGPHLHFEVQNINGSAYESMLGACQQDNESSWADQWTIDREFRVRNFGFVRGRIGDFYDGPPEPFPTSNHTDFSDTTVSYWMQGLNIPGDSVYRFRFIAPGGRLDFDSGERLLGFTSGGRGYRNFWATWHWTITDMRFEAGEWTVQIEINGELAVETTVRVFEEEQLAFLANRPPAPVVATIEPAEPASDDVLWARIYPDLVHDDPDFDVVRYTYTWKVNGETVREVVSAAHSDALPASYRGPGDVVTCDVAASDGVCPGDLTGDRVVDEVDLAVLLAAWRTDQVDLTGDGVVEAYDLSVVLAGWGECP